MALAERERLLGYLRRAQVAVPSMTLEMDRVEPGRGRVVPTSVRTDGIWVWSERLTYYLELYGYAPEPDFRRHIVAHGSDVPDVDPRVLVAASRLFARAHQDSPPLSTRQDGVQG